MLVAWYIGQAVGAVAHRVIDIQIQEYKKSHPLPKLSKMDVAGDDEGQEPIDLKPEPDGVAMEAAKPSLET